MTLSQSAPGESNGPQSHNELAGRNQDNETTFALFHKAAEAGLPAAQLALAQAYMARRAGADDLVQACMWYLVSAQRASQIRGLITRMMTPEQVSQAEQRAEAWLSRLSGSPIDLSIAPPSPATEDDSWKKPGRIGSASNSAISE
jgi:TPR repeat protein